MKKALIVGVSGQDGSLLANYLLSKGYKVFGSSRDSQSNSFNNLKLLGILSEVEKISVSINDFRSVISAINMIKPDEIYNLAGQTSVSLSFQQPVETIESILTSCVGVLINTSSNRHSTHHTSPLKFFEYLRSGLNVVAVDFPSHRNLPFSEQIYFFKERDSEGLIRAILKASEEALNTYGDLDKHSYEERTNAILQFIARPEGLEPPTL